MTDDPALDEALDVAIERAQSAQRDLDRAPLASPELVDKAELVEHRAEDVHELASDASKEASDATRTH